MGLARQTVADVQRMALKADEHQLAALERAFADDGRIGVQRALKSARARIRAQSERDAFLDSLYSFQADIAEERGANVVLGLDEVGRGPLAGPLAVGAVVLPSEPRIEGLNDSKRISAERRCAIAAEIKHVALAWDVEYASPSDIDAHGISAMLKDAFRRAISAVEAKGIAVDVVLLDGNPLRLDSREVNIVKGDGRCASIAAASIVAKVERDALMDELDVKHPGYGFASNKGYGTAEHCEAIRRLGLSPVHRRSFCSEFLQESLF